MERVWNDWARREPCIKMRMMTAEGLLCYRWRHNALEFTLRV